MFVGCLSGSDGVLCPQVEKPLEVAVRFLKPLQDLSSNKVISHLLAYSIHSRRR